MKHRSPIAVLLLPFITFGIYSIVWEVKTKGELNSQGATIPTAWLLIVPIVNIWWLYKYCEGVDEVTKGKMSAVISFLLLFLLGFIGQAIIQTEYNNLAAGPAAPETPTVPVEPAADALNAPAAPTPPVEAPAPETPTPPTQPTPPTPPSTPPVIQ